MFSVSLWDNSAQKHHAKFICSCTERFSYLTRSNSFPVGKMRVQGILLLSNSIEEYLHGSVCMLHCVCKFHLLCSESEACLVLGTTDYIHLFLFIVSRKLGGSYTVVTSECIPHLSRLPACMPLSSSLQMTLSRPFQNTKIPKARTSNQGQSAGQAES